jgi:hypothetical protein
VRVDERGKVHVRIRGPAKASRKSAVKTEMEALVLPTKNKVLLRYLSICLSVCVGVFFQL